MLQNWRQFQYNLLSINIQQIYKMEKKEDKKLIKEEQSIKSEEIPCKQEPARDEEAEKKSIDKQGKKEKTIDSIFLLPDNLDKSYKINKERVSLFCGKQGKCFRGAYKIIQKYQVTFKILEAIGQRLHIGVISNPPVRISLGGTGTLESKENIISNNSYGIRKGDLVSLDVDLKKGTVCWRIRRISGQFIKKNSQDREKEEKSIIDRYIQVPPIKIKDDLLRKKNYEWFLQIKMNQGDIIELIES